MNRIIISTNPFESEEWEVVECENVLLAITEKFPQWPATAKIYHNEVSQSTDVTPVCEDSVQRLKLLTGDFYVIVYPAEPITILYAVVAIVAVAAVMLARQVPNPAIRNTQSESPNNELSDRSNNPRPNARVPDIYGTVRSTPDLLSVPYKLFKDHQEVEYCYMCIGRGSYTIDQNEIWDDTTLVRDIAGTSVEVYAPNTSPNSGAPQLRIGDPINSPVYNFQRSNAVNGQVLRAPNDQFVRGLQNFTFERPNIIRTTSGIDLSEKFAAGDALDVVNTSVYRDYVSNTRQLYANSTGVRFQVANNTVPIPPELVPNAELMLTGALWAGSESTESGSYSWAVELSGVYRIASVVRESVAIPPTGESSGYTQYYIRINLVAPEQVNPSWAQASYGYGAKAVLMRVSSGEEVYNLNGRYNVLSATATTITLANPASVNSHWSTFPSPSVPLSPTLSTTGRKWVGPFVMDNPSINRVLSNFVAINGLYKDDGKNQRRFNVQVELEVTPVNAAGQPIGAAVSYFVTVNGSASTKTTRAATINSGLAQTGRISVRASRVTPGDLAFEGSVVDEIKWRDLYAGNRVSKSHFGDVTTVQSVTYATTGALSVKDRKLNMLVTRNIPLRISGSDFTTTLHPTRKMSEILSAICLDPYIGNRKREEIDFDNIYSMWSQVVSYFGHERAAEFCYTFDSKDLSFEETVQMVANATFCNAYRRGSVIKLSFEQETDNSTLLFNHKNKLPGSESRTVTFGNQNDFDGIALKYIDPTDDAQVTLYIPSNRTAVNEQEIETVGIRNGLQAYFMAWRAWNKVRYQNTITEFTATQEADILVQQDRILVADNTRTNTYDGQVEEQFGLTLTLSQPVNIVSSSQIFLQLADGTVESIPVVRGPDDYSVTLTRAPRIPLVLSSSNYAKTTYIITDNTRQNSAAAFLVTEKNPQENLTVAITAAIYDKRFYSQDKDFAKGIVNVDGIRI